MAELKKFETTTNAIKNSVVDDKLKPTAEMHILIGGPYTSSDGEIHRYGHTALRIKTIKSDLTYDFGRYGETFGLFGESGEGILRVWSVFNPYISEEVALKRKTTSFVYAIFEHQANTANGYYNELIKTAKKLEKKSTRIKNVYKLASDYHALGPNCTTLSIDGAKYAIPNIDSGSEKYIKPETVLTSSEQFAVKVKGGASRIFLPANLESFLNTKKPIKPVRVEIYGSGE
jgi:hypothetical protein